MNNAGKTSKGQLSVDALLLCLLILSLPFYDFSLFSIGTSTILRTTFIAGGLLIIVFFLRVLSTKGRFKVNKALWAVVAFNIACLLSIINLLGKDITHLVEFSTVWLQLAFVSLLFFSLANLRINSGQLFKVLQVWLLVAFLVSLYTIYQTFARNFDLPFAYLKLNDPLRPWQGAGVFGGYVRPSSTFAEPTYLGTYLLGPILLMMIPRRRVFFQNPLFHYLVLVTILLAFLLAFGLASWLTLIAVVFFAFWKKGGLRLIIRVIGIMFMVGLVILGIQMAGIPFSHITYRFEALFAGLERGGLYAISPGSIGVRLASVTAAFKVWISHPFLGVGLNNVRFYEPQLIPQWYIGPEMTFAGAHNMWVNVLAQVGIIGFIPFVLIWIRSLQMAKGASYTCQGKEGILAQAIFYILLADVIRGLMGISFIHPRVWLHLGLASLICSISKVRAQGFQQGEKVDYD